MTDDVTQRKSTVHGELVACEECGRPKSEYVDLGSKGVYRCWWCNDREVERGTEQ